ncbi:MAG TPA: CBM35 domain-containing protein [Ramlibacter sp.]
MASAALAQVPPGGVRKQAEYETISGTGVSVKNDLAGYEGSGFVGSFVDNGDRLSVSFPNVTAGSYNINIRYKTDAPQENFVVVNGTQLAQQWPATNPGWSIKTVGGVSLVSGNNLIEVEKYWGWINVDYVEIVPVGMQRIQAENGTISGSGVSVKTDLAGYEGSGFVGAFTNDGDRLSVSFANVAAGTYDINIRYKTDAPQENFVAVNGGTPLGQQWPATNPGWSVKKVPGVSLTAGTNVIEIIKYWGWINVDYVEIVRQDGSSTPAITLQTPTVYPNYPEYSQVSVLEFGPSGQKYWLDDNTWGSGSFQRGAYGGLTGSTFETQYGIGPVSSNGEISWRSAWKWPTTGAGDDQVKAYPGPIFGRRPGWYDANCPCPNGSAIVQESGQPVRTLPIGPTPGTFLPLQIGAGLPDINASFAFRHLVAPSADPAAGKGHIAFDIWLQNTAQQFHGADTNFARSHEIMIPLNYWGGYGEWSRRPTDWRNYCNCTFQHNGITFHVLHAEPYSASWSNYWAFTIFQPEVPLSEDVVRTFNISAFINFLRNMSKPGTGAPVVPATDWLVDIELGVEPIYGVGDVQFSGYRVWRP